MTNEPEAAEERVAPSILPTLPTIVWQRRWFLIVPLVLTIIGGFAVALLMRPVYESDGTVLIESPQLPADLVSSPVTDVIDQRIARTRERVLSRTDLIRLIRTNDLYPREQRTMPLSKIVDKMKTDTVLQAVSADLQRAGGARSGAPDTIAITIGFRYSDPVKAQVIAQQYVNRFLELDASTQTEQATGAAGFLGDQANALQAQIAAVDGKISAIKGKNGAIFAAGDQSSSDPTADAARMDSEIAQLESQIVQLQHMPDPNSGLIAAEQALRTAQARYADTHPDVIAAKAQVEAAQRAAQQNSGGIGLRAQIASDQQQIAALRTAKASILAQHSVVSIAHKVAPVLNTQVDQLDKQADALREQYRQIAGKLQTAQISARMQTEQKGERLVLADPPVVPDQPSRPNRPLIMVGSIAAGAAAGLALVLLVELMLRPLRGTAALTYAIGEAPLVVIPDFAHKPNPLVRFLEARRRRRPAATPG